MPAASPRRPRWALCGVLVMSTMVPALCALPATVDAQGDEGNFERADAERARERFNMGVSFFREEDYSAALVEFKRAYALVPHHKVLFNIGQVYIELHQYAEAVDHLERYLEQGGEGIDDTRRSEVEDLIADQRARVATLVVRVSEPGAEVNVDGRVVGVTPFDRPLRLHPGNLRIRVSKAGFAPEEQWIELGAGETQTLEVELTGGAVGGGVVGDSGVEAAEGPLLPTPVWIAGLATVGVGLGTVALALLTSSAESDLELDRQRLTTAERLIDRRDVVEARSLLTDVGLGLTVVGAVVTAVLLVNHLGDEDEDPDPELSLGVGVGPTGGQVALGGRF